MIYAKNQSGNNTDVLIAKEGKMYRTPNGQFLVLKLKDGVQYSETPGESNYNVRERLVRKRFKESEQKFDISGLKLHRTPEDEFKAAYQMMNLKQLKDNAAMTKRQIDSSIEVNYKLITGYIKYFSIPAKPGLAKNYAFVTSNAFSNLKRNDQISALANASSEARSVQDLVKNRSDRHAELKKNVQRANLEYQKKFTLSAACIALFLIGAPLGAIIRKGGLGLPVVVSVIFFLFYYIINTIGEKYVKDGDLSPLVGSWIAIVVITPIGIFLSYKAATDSAIFDVDIYRRFFIKLFQKRHVD